MIAEFSVEWTTPATAPTKGRNPGRGNFFCDLIYWYRVGSSYCVEYGYSMSHSVMILSHIWHCNEPRWVKCFGSSTLRNQGDGSSGAVLYPMYTRTVWCTTAKFAAITRFGREVFKVDCHAPAQKAQAGSPCWNRSVVVDGVNSNSNERRL